MGSEIYCRDRYGEKLKSSNSCECGAHKSSHANLCDKCSDAYLLKNKLGISLGAAKRILRYDNNS